MDDLISRKAAIDALADYIHNVDKVYSTGKLSADDCKEAAHSVLDDLPAAQPKRKKGKWVQAELEVGFVTCSYCKEHKIDGRMALRPDYANMLRFCPNCGARMEGRQE